MHADTAWDQLTGIVREISLLAGAGAVLAWDQQTYMPKGSGDLRGAQMASLSKIVHEQATSSEVGDLLGQLSESELSPERRAAVVALKRDYDREVLVPTSLIERASKASATGFAHWMEARRESDFAIFAPILTELLAIEKERAAYIDPKRHPLQVLMEPFDPGVSIPELQTTFARLQKGLTGLIQGVRGAPSRALGGTWPVEAQMAMHEEVAAALGYDFETGRLDIAEHPFTISPGHTDTRITTHVYPHDLLSGLGGTVHETGHALYEQGLPAALFGTGLDRAASFGLHESQSRFWENAIGRSLPFFEWLQPKLDAHFPNHGKTPIDLYKAANKIEPGLIRVHADEVTYNLHVILRFELELALFEDRLTIADLPDAWNSKYQEYLGLTPTNATEGVLQDVHWSGGAFAYFQSYTLGNLYAAAFYATMQKAMPDLDDRIRAGDFAPILDWLRTHVHSQGRKLDGGDRVQAVVGERDYVDDLLGYLWGRHGALYGLTMT